MFFEVTLLSNRLLSAKGALEIREKLTKTLPKIFHIQNSLTQSELTEKDGKNILSLYFFLIMKSDYVFLDFRKNHFAHESLDQSDTRLLWVPGNLWAEFDPHFLEGLRQVYRGYYGNDDVLFEIGLEGCGLIKARWPREQKEEVKAVFLKHFSNGRTDEISFDLSILKNSFTEIFKTLLKNKITLDKNFLYLGVMLITLYMTLSEIGGLYNASDIVLNEA